MIPYASDRTGGGSRGAVGADGVKKEIFLRASPRRTSACAASAAIAIVVIFMTSVSLCMSKIKDHGHLMFRIEPSNTRTTLTGHYTDNPERDGPSAGESAGA
jgi:hypothetical protein